MKKLDLQPTPDNVKSTFIDDIIERNSDLLFLIKLIDSIEDECYSIALDSYWGSGKTFFVKQLKLVFDANNEFTYDSVDDKGIIQEHWKKICTTHRERISADNHIAIYYDAWENDNDNDPILSIIYQIIKTTNATINLKNMRIKEKLPIILDSIIKIITKADLDIVNILSQSIDPLDNIEQSKSLQEKINSFIDDLIPEHGERLLIIIDELDRCNPVYAVKLLERIKHYFNNDRITFIFSVNLLELQHTIKQHYGMDFTADRYLDRFFDIKIPLSKPNVNKYLEKRFAINDTTLYGITTSLIIRRYNLQLREISRYIVLSKALINCKIIVYESNNPSRVVINYVFLPVMIALSLIDSKKYNNFISGKDVSPLTDSYNDEESMESLSYVLNLLLTKEELNGASNKRIEKNDIPLIHERIKEFYEKLFPNMNSYDPIGTCYIHDYDKKFFEKALSILSANAINSMLDIE